MQTAQGIVLAPGIETLLRPAYQAVSQQALRAAFHETSEEE